MRRFLLISLCAAGVRAQSPAESQAASIEKQRAAIRVQVTTITGTPSAGPSFFSAPWVDGAARAAAAIPPPCDPIATAELEKLIEQNSSQIGVKADLIRAVINQESGARPCAVSAKGAQGLMQLMPATAAQFNVNDPFDPKQNVEAGTKLLKQLLTKYNGDVSLALSAYNAGSARVDHDGGVPQIAETMQYVTSILARLPKH